MKHVNKVFLFCAFMMVWGCASEEKRPKNYDRAMLFFSEGTEKLAEKNYTQALTYLLQAAELEPERSDIQNNLGMAYYFKKNRAKAYTHIKNALILDPKNADARNNLATLYFEDKNYNLARKEYQLILKDLTYPKSNQIYYNLGKLELKLNNETKAKEFFNLSIQERSDSCASHFELGAIEFKNSRFKSALAHFQDAYKGVCYDNTASLYYQAISLQKMNKLGDAKTKLKEVIERFPKTRYAVLAQQRISTIKDSMLSEDELLYSDVKEKMNKLENANEHTTPKF